MGKELSEMTLKELWELFPIFLTKHNDAWAKNYEEMEVFIKRILSDYSVIRISHIGSTAVKGIWAKKKKDVGILYDCWGRPVACADNGVEEK